LFSAIDVLIKRQLTQKLLQANLLLKLKHNSLKGQCK